MADVRLSQLIAPGFFPVYDEVRRERYSEYWLSGGRGSGKSSFISLCILTMLLRDTRASAVIYRKVGDTLRDTVFEQMVWAAEQLGVSAYWQRRTSPMELQCPSTGQKILFRGADKAEKSKGLKAPNGGYFRVLWFEELTEFSGMEDVRTIKASVLRGTESRRAVTFYSYNPPMSAQNWVNGEALQEVPGRRKHHSDYRQMPPEWLGESFLAEAEALRQANERAYRHMYLGEVTGTGGQIFTNLCCRPVAADEVDGLPRYNGLDFGFASDPDAFVRCAYSRKYRRLYVVDEFVASGQSHEQLAGQIRKRLRRPDEPVTCDSADPRSREALRRLRVNASGAKKGPDSVDHGIRWLQNRFQIVIDTARCPCAAREFSQYEYGRDRAGDLIGGVYPDKNNHTIDAVRYAMEAVATERRAVVPR